jgi:hypothetical protein
LNFGLQFRLFHRISMNVRAEEDIQADAADAAPSPSDGPRSDRPDSPPGDDLVSLKREQLEAIRLCDFRRAQELQHSIDRLNTTDAECFLNERKSDLAHNLDSIAAQYRRTRAASVSRFFDLEVQERQRLDSEFEQLRDAHLDRLTALQEALFEDYKRELTKPLAKYNELLEQAQRHAKRQDFDLAQQHQDEAAVQLNDERRRRNAAFRRIYRAQIAGALAKQATEIEALKCRGAEAIAEIERQRAAELAAEAVQFRRRLEREYKRRADMVTNRARPSSIKSKPASVAGDRRTMADSLEGLEDTYREALIRYGLVEHEEAGSLSVGVRPGSQMSLRMQSKLEPREQRTSSQMKTDKGSVAAPSSPSRPGPRRGSGLT